MLYSCFACLLAWGRGWCLLDEIGTLTDTELAKTINTLTDPDIMYLHFVTNPWSPKDLLRTIATGRAHELGERAASMQRRWERNGRIVYKCARGIAHSLCCTHARSM